MMSKNSIVPFLKDYLIKFLTRPFLLDTNDIEFIIHSLSPDFTYYYLDFGGRSSQNAARFSGVTRKVLSYSKHTLPCSCEHQV